MKFFEAQSYKRKCFIVNILKIHQGMCYKHQGINLLNKLVHKIVHKF